MFKRLPELEAKLAVLKNENELLNDSLRQATASNRTLKHEKKALDKQVTTAENIGREALEATEAVNEKLTSTRQELKTTTRERDEVKAQLARITQERDEARLQTTLYKKKYLAGKKKVCDACSRV
jgi:chromosome segregation ATPase